MRHDLLRLSLVVTALVAVPYRAASAGGAEHEQFETSIRPVLVRYCYECHSAATAEPKGGLRVDSRDGLRRGGQSGAAVVPGKVEESLLMDALRHESLEMPPGKKLPESVIAEFTQWIAAGAADPRDKEPTAAEAAALSWEVAFAQRKAWWSLQPIKPAQLPKVADAAWPAQPIDPFILSKLEAAKLRPAPDADPSVLLRRLTFVVTGLPPTPEQNVAFRREWNADPERALASMVDELLASPHFGERFARHWMDVIRYADTYGYEWDIPAKGAWRFRDYLVRAFNDDIGFDQLVREQLAGDLLPEPRIHAEAQTLENLIAPMFYHLGEHRHGSSLQAQGIHQEMVNNKIDAFSKAFLATTVACARCHDHKLDAVSQRDYYALAAVFMTPRWAARAVDAPQRHRPLIERLKSLRGAIDAALGRRWQGEAAAFESRLLAAFSEPSGEASQPAVGHVQRWRAAFAAADEKRKPNLENVDDLGALLAATWQDPQNLARAWATAADAWRKERTLRLASNARNFQVIADFSKPELPAGWSMEGDGMLHGYVPDGTALVALDGKQAIERVLRRGYYTNALSPKLPGAVYSNSLRSLSATMVSVEIAGGGWASPRYVQSNALLSSSDQAYLTDQVGWKRFIASPANQPPEWVFRFELTTAALNPNFPGPTYLNSRALPPRETGDELNGWFSITGAVKQKGAYPPRDPLDHLERFFSGETPVDRETALRSVAGALRGAVERRSARQTQAGDVALVNWLLQRGLLSREVGDDARLAELVAEYRRVERQIALPRTVIGMDERGMAAADYPLDVRGDYDQSGGPVRHDFLQVFAGRNRVTSSPGSGRREMAEFLASAENPLTARVYVNRVWQWVFGTGLVATPDDFGHLGEKPSHPELLDALAADFSAGGWSTKALLRKLLLSRTFRQSGTSTPEARELDPANRLLHHYSTRRLEAEALYDSILAVSGRLDRTLFGPPIDPPRSKEDATKRLFSGPLDNAGRRALYMKVSLMQPPGFATVFNFPNPKLPTGRRDLTNVPTQALALLNDPFVTAEAEFWAERLVASAHTTLEARLQTMFVAALARDARPEELKRFTSFLLEPTDGKRPTAAEILNSREAWRQVAHLLFNTKEFLYYR